MNENEILDNLNVEDENGEIESEELNLDAVENILEDDPKTIDESFEESIDNEVDSTEDESLDIDLPEVEESENIENIDVEIESNNEEEDSEQENIEEIQEEVESEVETLENELEPEEEEVTLEDDISEIDPLSELIDNEETNELEDLSTDEEVIQEETVLEEEVEPSLDVMLDENIITDDLNNIKIEFGIEAKGFILSVHMMEAMIQKGYIFKDMLNDKVFDAVMIFNDNLENTIMTNDIKIKVEDGKIQLIKG